MHTPLSPFHHVHIGNISIGNHLPFCLIAGVNVLDHPDLNQHVASTLVDLCKSLEIPLIFKASFDKANRSGIKSARGPGLAEGLTLLKELKTHYKFPILTDIHEPKQARQVAEWVDCIQIPAFLCRQTDLLKAACEVGRPIHIKKMQMMAPIEMKSVLDKCLHFGQDQVILCERGTLFGYHQLIVDPLSIPQMKLWNAPISFDVTHALQQPGALGTQTGGRSKWTEALARSSVSQGIAALFIETHPEPSKALCDGPCAWPLNQMKDLLFRLKSLDEWAKSFVEYPKEGIL
jgi:2-dehydro-3-deoxyphosphooctonate aldolase (KDO 8-P synthase)